MAPPPGAPPGSPGAAPFGSSPFEAAPYGAPPPGAVATAGGPSSEPPKRQRTGLVVGLVVLALLVAGVVAAVLVLRGGDPDLELSIDTCDIAADGTMSASGTIRNHGGDRADVTIEVAFSDTDSGNTIETDRTSVSVPGGASERWSASGTAGDDVQRITCDVTATP